MIFAIMEMKMEIHVDLSSNAIGVKINFMRHAVRNFIVYMCAIVNRSSSKSLWKVWR